MPSVIRRACIRRMSWGPRLQCPLIMYCENMFTWRRVHQRLVLDVCWSPQIFTARDILTKCFRIVFRTVGTHVMSFQTSTCHVLQNIASVDTSEKISLDWRDSMAVGRLGVLVKLLRRNWNRWFCFNKPENGLMRGVTTTVITGSFTVYPNVDTQH